MTLLEIEKTTREYAAAEDALEEKALELREAIERLKREHMPAIKRALERAGETHTLLFHTIEDNPELFQRPKSRLVAGVVIGFRKQRDTLEWAGDEQLAEAIEKQLPALYPSLVEVKRKPVRDALKLLQPEQLQALGVAYDRGRDKVIIESANSEIEKWIRAIAAEAEREAVTA